MENLFNSSFGLKLNAAEVVGEILDFVRFDSKRSYKIIIGTDSLQLRDKTADFVTAVVVHREGRGGRYFWRRIRGGKFYTIRDRIIHEVVLSLDVAKYVLGKLQKEKISAVWNFEIHADVGVNGPTNV